MFLSVECQGFRVIASYYRERVYLFQTRAKVLKMILLLLGVTLAVLLYFKFIRTLTYWKNRGVIQGKPVPVFGDNLATVLRTKSWAELVTDLYNISPESRYVGVYQMNTPTLLLRDLDLIKQIGVKDFDHFLNHRDFIDPDCDILWGKNLFALKNEAWRSMRNTLSPCFTSSKMRSMFVLMNGVAEKFVDYLKEKDDEVIETKMKDLFTRFANDVIASTAFGITIDSLRNKNDEFYTMGTSLANFSNIWTNLKIFFYLLAPKVSRFFRMSIFDRKYYNFFKGIVEENIKTREANGIIRPDLIHLLMEAQKEASSIEEKEALDTGFSTAQEQPTSVTKSSKSKIKITNDDITAQAMVFFLGGFDTVSNLMCFLSYELAVNPEIQQKLREEVQATSEECNCRVTYEALLKMKYLDMVFSETLRKWPLGLVLDRVCTKPYVIEPKQKNETAVNLVPGDMVWIPTYAIHHDPKYYPEPKKFDPERFSTDNAQTIDPYTYLPFGVGPRNCIGSRFAILETKLVIFHMLLHFELVPVEKTVIPLKISKKSFNLTEDNGFWLGLKVLKI